MQFDRFDAKCVISAWLLVALVALALRFFTRAAEARTHVAELPSHHAMSLPLAAPR